jgi:hypothetical protein
MTDCTRLGLGNLLAAAVDESERGVSFDDDSVRTDCDVCGAEATALVHLSGEISPTRMCPACHWEASEAGEISIQHATVLLPDEPRRIGVRDVAIAYLDLVTRGALS